MDQGNLVSVLLRLSAAINSSQDLDRVLTLTCRAVVELFGVAHSGLARFDDDYSIGTVVAEYPEGSGLIGTSFPLRGVPFEEQLIATQSIVHLPDLRTATTLGPAQAALLDFGIRSMLIVPIVNKGRVIGSFGLDAIREPRSFTPGEAALCQDLANLVSVALENAQLIEEARAGREMLRLLYEASNAVLSMRDPDSALSQALDSACCATGAWFAVATLVDESRQPRQIAVSPGLGHPLKGIRPDGISMRVLDTGQPEFIGDTRARSGDVHPAMLEDGIAAAACLPLATTDRAIGVLWIHFRQPRSFNDAERHALQLYANQAAVAYESASRSRELERMSDAAEAMVSAESVGDVVARIAKSARLVLGADYAFIYPYDANRDEFVREQIIAENVPPADFRRMPVTGVTTRIVLHKRYLKITDLTTPQADFMPQTAREFLLSLGIRSFQAIRLEAGGEWLGALYVDHRTVRGFSLDDQRTLERFASQAAIRLKQARTLERLARAHRAAQAVAEISAHGNLERTLESIVDGARSALRCDIATVYAYAEEAGVFTHARGMGHDDPASMRAPQEVGPQSVLWKVIALRDQPYHLAPDAPNDPLLNGQFVRHERVRAAMALLLRFGERCVGVMFFNYRSFHRFSREEIDDMLEFGHQAAVAIRNAQLREEAVRQADALSALYEAGRAITGAPTLEQALQRIAEQALRVVRLSPQQGGYSHVALLEGNRLSFIAACPDDILQELRQKQEYTIDLLASARIGIAGLAAETRRAQNIPDVREVDDYIQLRECTRSQLSVPLLKDDQVIGVISLEHPALNAFSAEDVQNMELLAAQAAVAVDETHLRERISRSRQAARAIARMSTLGGLTETLGAIVRGAREAFGCDIAAIYTFDERTQRFVDHAADGRINPISIRRLDSLSPLSVLWRVINLDKRYHISPARVIDDALLGDAFVAHEGVQSALAVKLVCQDQRMGVMFVDYRQPHEFDDDEVVDAIQFADQAAIAIRNAQLLQETRRRAETLAGLYESGQTIAASLTQAETLDRIMEQALQIVGARFGPEGRLSHIALLQGSQLRLTRTSDPRLLEVLGAGEIRRDGRDGIAGRCARLKLSQNVADVGLDPDYIQFNPHTQSQLSVPIRADGNVIGVLSVEHPLPHAFADEDVRSLELLAAQAGVAIKNASLFEQVDRLRRTAGVVARVSTLGELRDTLKSIVHGACEALACDIATIYTFDEARQSFTLHESHGCRDPGHLRDPADATARKSSVLWEIVRRDAPYASADVPRDALLDGRFARREGVQAALAIPLRHRSRPVGVMFIDYCSPHRFTEPEIDAAMQFGNQAAVAIHDTQQYNELKQTYEELRQTRGMLNARTALAWVAMTANYWWHSVSGHAITIRNLVTMIRQDLATLLPQPDMPPGLNDRLARIDALAGKIENRLMTPPLYSEEGRSNVGINDFLRERLQQLRQSDRYRDIHFAFQPAAPDYIAVQASAEWLRRAVDLVIDNAANELQHVGAARRMVTVGTACEGGRVTISIADQGRGIPADLKSELFSRPVQKPGSQGLGIGLMMVQVIVEAYAGAVHLEDNQPAGTIVRIALPHNGAAGG